MGTAGTVAIAVVVATAGIVVDGSTPPPSTPIGDVDTELLLTLDDFPPGWEVESPAGSGIAESVSPGFVWINACAGEYLSEQVWGDAIPTAGVRFTPAESDFLDDGFSELIQRAPNDEAAADWVNTFDETLEECPAFTNDAGATTTFDRMLSLPELGDDSVAVYVLYSGPPPTAEVIIAVDDLLVHLTGVGDGISEIADVASVAVERARGNPIPDPSDEVAEVVVVTSSVP